MGQSLRILRSIAQRFFSIICGRQSILADCDCRRAGVLDLVGFDGVELDVFCVFRRNVCVRVDGVHGADLNACHAIDAVVGVNHHLVFHFVKARDRADFYAVGELAAVTFLGHNVGHIVSVIQGSVKKLCYEY